jgi:hypothetical protein
MDESAQNVTTTSRVSSDQAILFNSDSASMNESAEILEILSQDQPDAKVSQLEERLDTFTCFGKLPVEVRVIIWRFCFPRRREVYVKSGFDSLRIDTFRYSSHHPPPLVFRVNSESRALSLKHYCVLLQDIHRPDRRVYFHPSLDTVVFLDLDPLRDGSMLARASERLLTTFQNIQSLKLRHMWWSQARCSIIGPCCDLTDSHSGLSVQEERSNIVPGHFKSLHELFISKTPELNYERSYSLTYPGNENSCKRSLKHFFKMKAKADPEFKIPKSPLSFPRGSPRVKLTWGLMMKKLMGNPLERKRKVRSKTKSKMMDPMDCLSHMHQTKLMSDGSAFIAIRPAISRLCVRDHE